MIDVNEALKIILETTPKAKSEKILLSEARGRILAKDVSATRHQPPFDRVSMDGIGINTSTSKLDLQIDGVQAAGSPQLTLTNNDNCLEVMTGAMLPINCNCVIPYENINIHDGIATINKTDIIETKNIHKLASDYKQGDKVLRAGMKITSPVCAILASQGIAEVEVIDLPKIAIISTGTELVDLDIPVLEHQIYMSNSYGIENELKSYGLSHVKRIHIVDDKEATKKIIEESLNQNDILVLTGGVSKGKFDFIPECLEELGIHKHFHKIKQKPGKPMYYGTKGRKQVFALPGNPVSCLVCLRRYIIPSLNKYLEHSSLSFQGVLQQEIYFKRSFTYFVAVSSIYSEDGKLLLTPVKSNGSGDFFSLADSDGFIELPADKESFKAGEVHPYFPWIS